MRVIGNRILVRQDPPEKLSSILEIPDSVKNESMSGVVVGVGDKVRGLKVGYSVIFNKFDYEKVEIENEEYLVIHEQELKFIFKNKE